PDVESLDSRDTAARIRFYNEILERVRSLPGVEAASFADFVPSGGGRRQTTIGVENYTQRADEDMDVLNGVVASDYFKTMGMTLIAGREFTDQDKDGAARTVIVNEALARRYLSGQNALGKYLTIGGDTATTRFEIVGVVKDANAYIFQKDAEPFFYRPMMQERNPAMTLHVRSQGEPMALLPSLRNAVDALGQNVVLRDAQPLSEVLNESLLMLRVVSTLTALFGVLALSLALVGVFSVVNYSTSRRTREIGIRLALGARRADIMSMIMKEGLFIVGAGVVVGLLLAFASGRLISSLMFAGAGSDVLVYAVVALLQIGIAMLACFVPAYKATRVELTDALRHE
ncbi:MAG TPA: FtsX-like permease family protein, partial [Pyrinomonadaceae bacterium]|nr:FtsX-like permease family protein [Pyrinomonadaceae bacterium]